MKLARYNRWGTSGNVQTTTVRTSTAAEMNGILTKMSEQYVEGLCPVLPGTEQTMRWKLKDWELTIEKIVAEISQEPKQSGKHRTLNNWRVQLENEPNLLQAFQIDMIVREVRRRLKGNGK